MISQQHWGIAKAHHGSIRVLYENEDFIQYLFTCSFFFIRVHFSQQHWGVERPTMGSSGSCIRMKAARRWGARGWYK